MHLLSRHDDLQKSSSQTINFESKYLRWTNATRSWNVKLQVTDYFHERLVSFDKNLWRVYRWQKSQNQLSISCEITDVHHAKDSIWHNVFHLSDQSLRFQLNSDTLTSRQANLSLSTKNISDETDVSRSVKITKELYEFRLNRRSEYQTINLRIRIQRWQWSH